MSEPEVIVVGSGINSLVAAALLAKKGRKVLVPERNDEIGGCIRTDESTAFRARRHGDDLRPVDGSGYTALADDLGRHGLQFA